MCCTSCSLANRGIGCGPANKSIKLVMNKNTVTAAKTLSTSLNGNPLFTFSFIMKLTIKEVLKQKFSNSQQNVYV